MALDQWDSHRVIQLAAVKDDKCLPRLCCDVALNKTGVTCQGLRPKW
jgi:hypothetical protein